MELKATNKQSIYMSDYVDPVSLEVILAPPPIGVKFDSLEEIFQELKKMRINHPGALVYTSITRAGVYAILQKFGDELTPLVYLSGQIQTTELVKYFEPLVLDTPNEQVFSDINRGAPLEIYIGLADDYWNELLDSIQTDVEGIDPNEVGEVEMFFMDELSEQLAYENQQLYRIEFLEVKVDPNQPLVRTVRGYVPSKNRATLLPTSQVVTAHFYKRSQITLPLQTEPVIQEVNTGDSLAQEAVARAAAYAAKFRTN